MKSRHDGASSMAVVAVVAVVVVVVAVVDGDRG